MHHYRRSPAISFLVSTCLFSIFLAKDVLMTYNGQYVVPPGTYAPSRSLGSGDEHTYLLNLTFDEEGEFDFEVVLDVDSGDADLVVAGPVLTPDGTPARAQMQRVSDHFTGQEYIFLSRYSIQKAGQGLYQARVRGYGSDNSYRLTLEKTFSEREPPADEQAVLEAIYKDCCEHEGSCRSLSGSVRAAKPNGDLTSFCHVPNQGCDKDGHITALRLPGESLRCDFPQAIRRLPWLTRLGLEDNNITGRMEEVLDILAPLPLESLHLGSNKLSGSLPCIPKDVALSNITVMHLSSNEIAGRIPSCFLTSGMQVVVLERNSLTGGLPRPLPELPSLQMFIASMQSDGAGITGTIPDLAAWPALTMLDLGGNRLRGPFPELPPLLRTLRMDSNELSGELPADLSGEENLREIDVARNRMSGPLPLSLPPEIRALRLGGNSFSGPIPHRSWFPDTTKMGTNPLRELRLGGNALTGTVPSHLALLPNLWALDLSGNRLGGSLTPYVDLITRNVLLEFDVSDNELTGPLPVEITRMLVLRQYWNNWTVWQVSHLTRRPRFDVSGNDISGPFPVAILEDALDESRHLELGLEGNRFECPEEGRLNDTDVNATGVASLLRRLDCVEGGEVVWLVEQQGIDLPVPTDQANVTAPAQGNSSQDADADADVGTPPVQEVKGMELAGKDPEDDLVGQLEDILTPSATGNESIFDGKEIEELAPTPMERDNPDTNSTLSGSPGQSRGGVSQAVLIVIGFFVGVLVAVAAAIMGVQIYRKRMGKKYEAYNGGDPAHGPAAPVTHAAVLDVEHMGAPPHADGTEMVAHHKDVVGASQEPPRC
uniref:Receptor kinase n=1 Tax=Tetraselmis sp. GSL018 TaxID=582737 RepID=A0A061QV96_9CHLO